MFRYKELINETGVGFIIDDVHFYYYIKNQVFEYSSNNVLAVDGKVKKLLKYNDFLFVEYFSKGDGFERNEQFEISTGEKVINAEIYRTVLIPTANKQLFFLLKADTEFNSFLSIYNLEKNYSYNNICKNPFKFYLNKSNLILFPSKNVCQCIDYQSKVQKWQFDFSILPCINNEDSIDYKTELINIIGIYNESLWLLVSETRLVSINLLTGKLKDIISILDLLDIKFGSTMHKGFIIDSNYPYHLNEKKGILHCLSGRIYWEFNLQTLEGFIKKDFGENTNTNWRITKSRFYEDDSDLYFIGAHNGEAVNRAVGIFDTVQSEIVWYDEPLEVKKFLFFSDIPQANATILGVLDSEKNLRVYERSEIK